MPTSTKPGKPRKDFPLFAHRNGQWSKKIKGRLWYFGKWADPDAALQNYVDQRDDIHAGRDPKRQAGVATPNGLTVADMVNHYLESLSRKVERGTRSARHFSDCVQTGTFLVEHFGRRTSAGTLRAADFSALRDAFPSSWGHEKSKNEIQRIRTVFRWAAESELIPGVPNFGPDFKKPGKSEIRRGKARQTAAKGSLDFTADELQTLIDAADDWLKACILLGINGGFGNTDCARLREDHIDFETGWYDLPRMKSGIPRQCFLWARTRDAVQSAMHERPISLSNSDDGLCFLTRRRRPVVWESIGKKGTLSVCDNVGKSFAKLVKACEIRNGRGFYCLRRTFETVAGNTRDQVAVNLVMGHSDASMAEVYRQGIDQQRLRDVADHVERWLYPDESKE